MLYMLKFYDFFNILRSCVEFDLIGNRMSSQILENEQSNILLSDEDRDHFLESLKNPPLPNQKLKDAFNFYFATKFKDT